MPGSKSSKPVTDIFPHSSVDSVSIPTSFGNIFDGKQPGSNIEKSMELEQQQQDIIQDVKQQSSGDQTTKQNEGENGRRGRARRSLGEVANSLLKLEDDRELNNQSEGKLYAAESSPTEASPIPPISPILSSQVKNPNQGKKSTLEQSNGTFRRKSLRQQEQQSHKADKSRDGRKLSQQMMDQSSDQSANIGRQLGQEQTASENINTRVNNKLATQNNGRSGRPLKNQAVIGKQPIAQGDVRELISDETEALESVQQRGEGDIVPLLGTTVNSRREHINADEVEQVSHREHNLLANQQAEDPANLPEENMPQSKSQSSQKQSPGAKKQNSISKKGREREGKRQLPKAQPKTKQAGKSKNNQRPIHMESNEGNKEKGNESLKSMKKLIGQAFHQKQQQPRGPAANKSRRHVLERNAQKQQLSQAITTNQGRGKPQKQFAQRKRPRTKDSDNITTKKSRNIAKQNDKTSTVKETQGILKKGRKPSLVKKKYIRVALPRPKVKA